MNDKIKNLIDELISFKKNRIPTKHLQKMYDEEGEIRVYSTIKFLLLWIKEVAVGNENRENYELPDGFYGQFSIFFEKCPELAQVFSLQEEYLGWSAEISEIDRDEIIDYIHNNHKISIRLRSETRKRK